jgi:tetratricopeptide (TPR) repeat protein
MGEADVTAASNKLAKAQEVAALKGLRAAVPFYVEATDALGEEKRFDAAVGVLAEVLNAREKKRSLFGSKEINPLGPDRAVVARQFAKLTRGGQINDSLLELLSAIAVENPDDPQIRLANAEGLYRAGYMADAIDEYRYCEKLLPDDGGLVARLGELYAIMSRNAEAVDNLRRGIGELMQSHHFDEVAFFSHKLIEVAPQAVSDVQRWLNSMPDDALRAQRDDIRQLLDAVRDKGLDDGRWESFEQRVAALAEAEEIAQASGIGAVAEPHAELAAPAAHEFADEPADEPEPVWGSKTGNVAIGRTAWDDVANVEPASEDEMRMLLGPALSSTPEPEEEAQPAAPAPEPVAQKPSAAAATNGATSRSAASPPASGTALPPGLAAFTRRKADAAFTAGDFVAAAQSYERLLKGGFEADVASPLLECYLGSERFAEAAELGLQLADTLADAGEHDQAVATLALVLEHTQDAHVERRHAELIAAK